MIKSKLNNSEFYKIAQQLFFSLELFFISCEANWTNFTFKFLLRFILTFGDSGSLKQAINNLWCLEVPLV